MEEFFPSPLTCTVEHTKEKKKKTLCSFGSRAGVPLSFLTFTLESTTLQSKPGVTSHKFEKASKTRKQVTDQVKVDAHVLIATAKLGMPNCMYKGERWTEALQALYDPTCSITPAAHEIATATAVSSKVMLGEANAAQVL